MKKNEKRFVVGFVTILLVALGMTGCAAPIPSDDAVSEAATGGQVQADDVGVLAQMLTVRQYARQSLKIRGAFTEHTSYVEVPVFSARDEHADPTGSNVRADGRCSDGFIRDSVKIVHKGNGSCSFDGWVHPADDENCAARIRLNHSAGGDNIWNGECEVRVFEREAQRRSNSCANRCGGPWVEGATCQCDRQCSHYDDCCDDLEALCL